MFEDGIYVSGALLVHTLSVPVLAVTKESSSHYRDGDNVDDDTEAALVHFDNSMIPYFMNSISPTMRLLFVSFVHP